MYWGVVTLGPDFVDAPGTLCSESERFATLVSRSLDAALLALSLYLLNTLRSNALAAFLPN